MVVFKRLLLFLIMFCIPGIHSKPPYDEQAEASGMGSTLWGWVSYFNPWGSSAGTNAPPKLEQGINSSRIKADSVIARQMTAATIPVNTTVQEPISDKSLERKVTTPIIPVQISTTTEPTAKLFMEPKASMTVKSLSENNPLAAKDSWKLLASTTPTAFVLDNPSTTEATISEQHIEPDVLDPDQEIPRIKHSATDYPSDTKASTISITSDLDNPTTTEEPATEQPMEPKSSTYISFLNTSIITEETTKYLLEATPTKEPATEQPLELEVTTISIVPDMNSSITVEELLESKAVAPNSQTVSDYQLKSELSTPSIVMVLNFPTSTEEITMEQPLGPELSTTASALNDPAKDVPPTADHLEPETTTTFIATIALDQKHTTMTEDIATEHSLKLEVTTVEEHTLEVVVPTEPVSTATLSTDSEGALFSGLYVTYMEADEPSITTELDVDPYTRLHEVMFKSVEEVSFLSDIPIDSSISLHEVMFKPVTNDPYPGAKALLERVDEESTQTSEIASLLTKLGRDPYTQVTVVIPAIDEDSPERSNSSKPTELVTDLYLKVASVVSKRNQDLTERSEESILTKPATNPYLGVAVVVSERIEETEGSGSIIAEPVTHPYISKIGEESVSPGIVPNQFLQVEEGNSTEVKASIEVNTMLRAVKEAMLTEKDEVIDLRVSRSHSGGFLLRFNHFHYMLLFYAVLLN